MSNVESWEGDEGDEVTGKVVNFIRLCVRGCEV